LNIFPNFISQLTWNAHGYLEMNKKAKLFLSPLSVDVPHPLSLLLFLPLNLYQKLALSLSASLNQKSQETLSSPSPALHPSLTFSLTTANGHLRRLPYLSLRRKGSGHSEEEWALLPLRRSCLSLSRAKSFRPPVKNGFWTNPSFWVSGFFSTNGGLGLLVFFFIFYSFSYFEKFWAVFQPQNLFNIRLKKKITFIDDGFAGDGVRWCSGVGRQNIMEGKNSLVGKWEGKLLGQNGKE
jgi:hypothetical protein